MERQTDHFKQMLDKALAQMVLTPQRKTAIRQGVRLRRRRQRILWGTAACAAVFVLVFTLAVPGALRGFSPSAQPGASQQVGTFELAPDQATAGLIQTDSGFLLNTATPMSAAEVQNLVVFTPASQFSVDQKSDTSFYLKPESLLENTVYQIALQHGDGETPATWAFQTDGALDIISTLPSSNVTGVPVETGIELSFSGAVSELDGKLTVAAPDGSKVPGRIEYHGRTGVFVPSETLAEDTIYTVTAAAGLKDSSGRVLGEDYVFSFRTARSQADVPYFTLSGNYTESFLPTDPVVVELSADARLNEENSQVHVELYALDQNEYLDLAERQQKSTIPGLSRTEDFIAQPKNQKAVMTFDTALQWRGNNVYLPAYAVFPESPGAGWYLADLTTTCAGTDLRVQKLIQVSDASVYLQSQNGSTYLWLNSASSAGSVSGASIKLQDLTAKTAADGLAVLETGDLQGGRLTVEYGDVRYAEYVSLAGKSEALASQQYYAYLYTDRTAYLPDDTIHFWGIVLPRSGAQLPSQLEVRLDEATGITVEVGGDGSFSGELAYTAYQPTYCPLYAQVDGSYLCSTGVEIMDYTKPSYLLSVTPDKSYYLPGDTAHLTVSGTFYDGTPADGLAVSVSLEQETRGLTLDSQGVATVSIAVPTYEAFQYRDLSLSVWASGQEDHTSPSWTWVPYFTGLTRLETEDTSTDGGISFKLSARALDLAKADASQNLSADYYAGELDGEAAEVSAVATVYRNEYVPVESGEYYDFIQKKTVKQYDYQYQTTQLQTFPLQTESGVFQSPLIEVEYQPRVSYSVSLQLRDSNGGKGSTELYLNGRSYYPRFGDYETYQLLDGDLSPSVSFTQQNPVQLQLYGPKEKVQGGTLLYLPVKENVFSPGISRDGKVTLPFSEEQVPNFYIYGAYFDGKHVFPISPSSCYFDSAGRELQLTVQTDKEQYRPGETVEATVKVTRRDGTPVVAPLVLSAVDEAAFAVKEQEANPLQTLYQPAFYSNVITTASYVQHPAMDDVIAEGGGEGESAGVRRDFKDTACFVTATSDETGTARVSFKLPDNLTTWRLTAVAAARDKAENQVLAGAGRGSAVVSIPYFVHPILNDKYLAGDEVNLSLRSAGKSINAQTEIQYTVTLTGDASLQKKASGLAAGAVPVQLGKLEAGNYTVRIQGKAGEYSDTLEQKFTVADSLLTTYQSVKTDLDGAASIQAVRYPVTLYFYDRENSLYMDALTYLQTAWGERTDQKAARNLAAKLLQELGETGYPERAPILEMQESGGGVRLLPYGDTDPLLTAQLCVAVPDQVNLSFAKNYFYRILYNRESASSQVAAAYLGLAALSEPVLLDMANLLASDGLPQEDQILLAYGLALLGDVNSAATWYDKTITPQLKMLDNQKYCGSYQLTAQAAALAYRIHSDDFQGLMEYVLNTPSGEYTPVMEIAAYLAASPLPKNNDAQLSYTKDGQQKTVTLKGLYTDQFTQKQLENGNFQAVSGDIGVRAVYTGDGSGLESDSRIQVQKHYERQESYTMVTLQVDFTAEAPVGYYTVTDIAPSGARFVYADLGYGQGWYLSSSQGETTIFQVDRGTDPNSLRDSVTITYYLRTALPGSYVTERCAVVHNETGLTAFSKRGTLSLS